MSRYANVGAFALRKTTVRTRYALVNLAAFLAQSMKETIRYDACDENNWDSTNNYQIPMLIPQCQTGG